MKMKQVIKDKFTLLRQQHGVSMVETLVAIGIIGIIGTVFLSTLMNISKQTGRYQDHVTAQILAQAQIEIVRSTAYDSTSPYYDSVSAPASAPPGYTISISTAVMDVPNTKQEVTVTVTKAGSYLFKLVTIKVKS